MGEALVNAFFLKSQRGCAGRGSHKASIIDGFMEEHGEIAFTEMPCKSHGIIPIFTTENCEGGRTVGSGRGTATMGRSIELQLLQGRRMTRHIFRYSRKIKKNIYTIRNLYWKIKELL